MDGLPLLASSGETGCKAFIANENSWWGHHTDCIKFSKRADRSRCRFNHQVQTDGVSVSVLEFQPHVESPAASSTTPSAPPASKKRKRQEHSAIGWVKGLPDRHLIQPQRIVGLDPGRKALFTAVVHSQQAADSLQEKRPCEHRYDSLSWSCSRWQEAAGIKYMLHRPVDQQETRPQRCSIGYPISQSSHKCPVPAPHSSQDAAHSSCSDPLW